MIGVFWPDRRSTPVALEQAEFRRLRAARRMDLVGKIGELQIAAAEQNAEAFRAARRELVILHRQVDAGSALSEAVHDFLTLGEDALAPGHVDWTPLQAATEALVRAVHGSAA